MTSPGEADFTLVKRQQTDSLSTVEHEAELIDRMFGSEIAALFGAKP